MVKRLNEMPEVEAAHLRRLECPTYDLTALLPGKPLGERRVSIISTAGGAMRASVYRMAAAVSPSIEPKFP